MRDALKIFDRYINEKNLLKVTKNKFYTSFLNGSNFYDDFIYLKDELPEYLKFFNIKENWQDGLYHKYVDEDYCFFTNKNNIILGEVKFLKNKPLFARFNHNGAFATYESFLIHNNKLYKGNIPCSELGKYYDLSKRDFFGFKMISIETNEEFSIERFRFSNFIDFNFIKDDIKISLKINLNNKDDYCLYIQKIIYNKINTECFTKKIDTNHESFIKDIKPYLNKIIDIYYILDKNNFKKDELTSYYKIFDIFNNKIKNYKFKTIG